MKYESFSLQAPTIGDFSVDYYFRYDTDPIEARTYAPHMHDSVELYILLEGDASFVVEHSLYRLAVGDVIITKPNEIHHCILNTDSKHDHSCFWLRPPSCALFSEFLQREAGCGNLISPPPEQKQRLLVLYQGLCEAGAAGDKHRQLYLLLEFLDILRKNMDDRSDTEPFPTMLQTILEDIDRNFLTINSLEYFGERFFLSPSTLNRLFRTHLHTTPKLYLEAKRLAHSRQLLRQGKSVLAACIESGYPDPSNYIRLFKKRFGVTPGQYREGSAPSELRIEPK